MKNKKMIIILIIIICIILIISIFIVNKMLKMPEKTYGTEIDKSEEIYDTDFNMLRNIDIFFSVHDVANDIINNLSTKGNENILYDKLDGEYIEYYKISKKNIADRIEKYNDINWKITDIKSAKTSGNFATYLIETSDNTEKHNFIVRVDYANLTYSVFLPDFVEEYGLDNYISNILLEEVNIKKNDNNRFDYLVLSSTDILEKYSDILNKLGFEYVYQNYISEETKNNYSEEELRDFYKNEDTFFNRPALVDFNENNYFEENKTKYTFKDRKMNEYIINVEENPLDMKIDITITEDKEEDLVDGGLLEIIEQ